MIEVNTTISIQTKSIELWKNTLIVIVLYNSSLLESHTYQSLKQAAKDYNQSDALDLLICDNSPISQINIELDNYAGYFNLYYLHDPENVGISKSYNRAAELANFKDKKWLLVLDQDTTLPKDSLFQYSQSVAKYPGFPIYAPKVYSSALLLSPCRYWFRKGSSLRSISIGVNSMLRRNVLNSGLLISLEALRRVGGYDENVWLYFSDFVFFDRLKLFYKEFVVVDISLAHQLSSSDYQSFDFAINRFSEYCKGAHAAAVSQNSKIAYFEYVFTIGLRSLLMSSRFRDFSFYRIFLTIFFDENTIDK